MKPLFELPELLTIDGLSFSADLESMEASGLVCKPGCKSGVPTLCETGCDTGTTEN